MTLGILYVLFIFNLYHEGMIYVFFLILILWKKTQKLNKYKNSVRIGHDSGILVQISLTRKPMLLFKKKKSAVTGF